MQHQTHRMLGLMLSLLLISLCFTGCSVNTEKNPAFLKLKERIAQLEDNQKKNRETILDLFGELDILNQEFKAIQADLQNNGGSPEQRMETAMLLERVESFEKRLAMLNENVEKQGQTVQKAVAKAESAAEKAARESRAPRQVASSDSKPAATASSSRGEGNPPGIRKPAAREATPQKPAGTYYSVRPGDTLQSVARKHSVSSADICRANRMPLSAPLYAGQRLFIPPAG